MSKQPPEIRCSECGAFVKAACNCEAPYISAKEYAARHMDLEKSDRLNAKEIGVSKDTVARARNQLAQEAPVKQRKGKDGKSRKLPKKKDIPPAKEFLPQEEWEFDVIQVARYILTRDKEWAERFGTWKHFHMTQCTYETLCRAAQALNELISSNNPAANTNRRETSHVVSDKQRSEKVHPAGIR